MGHHIWCLPGIASCFCEIYTTRGVGCGPALNGVDLLECDSIEDVGYALDGNAGDASEIFGTADPNCPRIQ
jgi:hypothetical protein